jgi:hypothetical protein
VVRLLSIITLIFLFNTAFMSVLGAAHDQSHQDREGISQITWSDDQASAGLFQIVHDDHHDQTSSSNSADHSGDHQCHHISVIGMIAFVKKEIASQSQAYIRDEPIFSFKSFPSQIEYPPKNA